MQVHRNAWAGQLAIVLWQARSSANCGISSEPRLQSWTGRSPERPAVEPQRGDELRFRGAGPRPDSVGIS